MSSYECPLSICPRSFETASKAEDHCARRHGIVKDELDWFNDTYEPPKDRASVRPDSIGTAVNFEYVKCETCGASKTLSEYEKATRDVTFCSKKCRSAYFSERFSGSNHPNWKEDPRQHYYGANWEEQRSKRIALDGRECFSCGISDKKHQNIYSNSLHVHHIVPRSEFRGEGRLDWEQANKLTNLVSLCSSCHSRLEGKQEEFFEEAQKLADDSK
ncbi:HNH endonuclease [Halogeometricum rufum]|uniref:HNH endonuclease n=1 Tax=Halogeometricum rufum TaxID=553469 RepID=A0A1I6IWW9_9EURY|nr:HNH endonuclease [Halogeometricum rufum]